MAVLTLIGGIVVACFIAIGVVNYFAPFLTNDFSNEED